MGKKNNSRDSARTRRNDVERDLLDGFRELAADLERGDLPTEKYTCHRLELDIRPSKFGPNEVQATRRILSVSQSLFAQFLGVSPKTVRGWESGKPVSGLASRFMDEIRRDPEYWRNRLKDVARAKSRRGTGVQAKAGKSA
jgi:DNA-binding transcriptional regulator YiaG